MKRVIWKYDLNTVGSTTLELPLGSKLCYVAWQNSMYGKGLKAWIMLDPGETIKMAKEYISIMTGEGTPTGGEFFGTVFREDGIVLHVFEGRT